MELDLDLWMLVVGGVLGILAYAFVGAAWDAFQEWRWRRYWGEPIRRDSDDVAEAVLDGRGADALRAAVRDARRWE